MPVARAPITTRQYMGFRSPEGYRDELVNGRIVVSPIAKPLHQGTVDRIRRELERCMGAGWTVNGHTNLKLQRIQMPAPDLFVIDTEEWESAEDQGRYVSKAPALVIEVISPANKKLKVVEKTAVYLDMGVPEVWNIDPRQFRVDVFRAGGESLSYAVPFNSTTPKHELYAPLSGTVMLGSFFRYPVAK